MTYKQMKDVKSGHFTRACGVHLQSFETMVQVLREHEHRKVKPVRPPHSRWRVVLHR